MRSVRSHFPPFSYNWEMRNIRIIVQYDGTRYKGWQRQTATEQTIQGKLESILARQFGRTIEIDGSGRTDAGVHARGQVANFRLKDEEMDLFHRDMEALTDLLNSYLPEDIAVLLAEPAADRFHSRLNAVSKTYKYRIWNSPVPNVFDRKYVWQVREPLDLSAIKAASEYLLGEHDFAAFCGNPRMKKSTVRRIDEIRVEKNGPEIDLIYTGNGFLQNMVRILTGTLAETGRKERCPEEIREILGSRDRQKAGIKAPAQGLILWEVKYD